VIVKLCGDNATQSQVVCIVWVCRVMKLASTKALPWSIFSIICEQWNDHHVLNYRKTSLKLPLFSSAIHYPTDPVRKL